jgi:predicted alpha/beta hydrolase family esterase
MKYKPNIVYFQGRRQDDALWDVIHAENPKPKMLAEISYKLTIIPTGIDYNATRDRFIKELTRFELSLEYGQETIIVGHSLGGPWAYKFAAETGHPVILINPALRPTYYANKLQSMPVETTFMLTEDDTVCPIEDTLKIIKEGDFQGEIIRFKSGGHRFIDEDSITALRDVINNYIPCFD